MGLKEVIANLEASIPDPTAGLPEDVFLFASRIVPIVNVDLLIRNDLGHTLLTWRDDKFSLPGWHVPGGIVRYRETFAERIRAVARNELGTDVNFMSRPLAIHEVIDRTRKDRGHFISLLFQCNLLGPPAESLRCMGFTPKSGQWKWHSTCPKKLIGVHEMYRTYIQ